MVVLPCYSITLVCCRHLASCLLQDFKQQDFWPVVKYVSCLRNFCLILGTCYHVFSTISVCRWHLDSCLVQDFWPVVSFVYFLCNLVSRVGDQLLFICMVLFKCAVAFLTPVCSTIFVATDFTACCAFSIYVIPSRLDFLNYLFILPACIPPAVINLGFVF